MEEDLSYDVFPGGNDVFASNGTQLLITDIELGEQFTASVIDFNIDDVGTGYVYIDGELKLEQESLFDYNALEQMFYSVYSVEQI
jgi:hypothetical protein